MRRCVVFVLFLLAVADRAAAQTVAITAAQRADVDRLAADLHAKVVETRRDIHRHPELGYRETRTAGARRRSAACAGVRRSQDGHRQDRRRRHSEGRPAGQGGRRARRHGRPADSRADRRAVQVHRRRRQTRLRARRACGHRAGRRRGAVAPARPGAWHRADAVPAGRGRRSRRRPHRRARGCSTTGCLPSRSRARSSGCMCCRRSTPATIGLNIGAGDGQRRSLHADRDRAEDPRRLSAHRHRPGPDRRADRDGAADDSQPPDQRAAGHGRLGRRDQGRQPLQHHRRQGGADRDGAHAEQGRPGHRTREDGGDRQRDHQRVRRDLHAQLRRGDDA